MDETFSQIEHEISRLNADIAQLLTRVENIRHALTELQEKWPDESKLQVCTEPGGPDPDIEVHYDVEEPENSIAPSDTDVFSGEPPVDITDNAQSEQDMAVSQSDLVTEDLDMETVDMQLPPIPPLAHVDVEIDGDSVNTEMASVSETPDAMNSIDMSVPESEYDDLRKLFTINDRYRFRRELFGNDNVAMSDTINMISAMKSMSEAEDYVYSDLEWDKGNDDVRAFMDIITFYFLRKK